MSETTPDVHVAVPLLAPAQGVPDVIDTPEKFESALVQLKKVTARLPLMPSAHLVINTVRVLI